MAQSACADGKRKLGKVIIDTDAGGDDAVAIAMAICAARLNNPLLEIVAITCVNGNANVDQVTINVFKVLETANATDIPVYVGTFMPILRTVRKDNFFGMDAFGDFDYGSSPDISLAEPEHAANALVRLVKENPGEITIVALGPLTNIALASRLDASFRQNVQNIIILGGCVTGHGNIAPGREFNFFTDPEAVYIVFNDTNSDAIAPLVIITIDTRLNGDISVEWRQKVLGGIPTPMMGLLNKVEGVSLGRVTSWHSYDAWAMALALRPALALSVEHHHIEAVIDGQARGGLLVDYRDSLPEYKNVIFVTLFDILGFQKFVYTLLSEKTDYGTNSGS